MRVFKWTLISLVALSILCLTTAHLYPPLTHYLWFAAGVCMGSCLTLIAVILEAQGKAKYDILKQLENIKGQHNQGSTTND